MHEHILEQLKKYNNKYNQLDDAFQRLQQQYDKTQYELKCVKKILLDVCAVVSPHNREMVQELLDRHDKVFKTVYENGSTPLASIRFEHHLTPQLDTIYVWDTL